MKKRTWFVFQYRGSDGKMYAVAQSIRNNENLVGYAEKAVKMNACDSMDEALRIAELWNRDFEKASES